MGRRGRAVALCLGIVSACTVDEGGRPSTVFRVGASSGLSRLTPGDLDGSAAAAADLVFEFAPGLIDGFRATGTRVELTRDPAARFSAEQLAAAVRYRGLRSARALDRDRIEVVLEDEADARGMVERGDVGFDLGPFAVESEKPGEARLRRRGGAGVDVIDIVEVSSADEWRKFLARELDVLSSSPTLYRAQFEGMDSVRVVDVPPVASAALFFNVRDPALAGADVRRRIAAALNRAAIARVVTGDTSAAAEPFAAGGGEAAPLPPRLSVIVPRDESSLVLAAGVLRHQLARIGISLVVDALPLQELLERTELGEHQMMLGQLAIGRRIYSRFLSPRPDRPSVTGFADAAFDAAVERGDLASAEAIFAREVPATLLFEWRTFAAIDSRFCGEVTPTFGNWRWMADLGPCDARAVHEEGTP